MISLVVGITGASGAIYGIRLLEVLVANDVVKTHLIVSKGFFVAQASQFALVVVHKLAMEELFFVPLVFLIDCAPLRITEEEITIC